MQYPIKKTALILPAFALLLIGAGCSQSMPSDTNTEEPVRTTESVVMEEETNTTTAPQDGEFALNTEASVVTWRGAKKIGGAHEGTIAISQGTLLFEAGKLTSGTVVIDMDSLKSTDLEGDMAASLETHLKSADFFDVETYKEATFEIGSVTYTSETTADVAGTLTLHGVSNPVTLSTTLEQQDETWIATAAVTLDRTLWNVNFGSGSIFKELGDAVINDEMEIEFTVETK